MNSERHNPKTGPIYHNFFRLSVIGRWRQWIFPFWTLLRAVLSLLNSSKLNLHNSLTIAYCGATLCKLMQRLLAPLRRITSRDLRVFEFDRVRKTLPQSFVVIDTLECGHEYTCFGWSVFDLLFAYTENPEVSAKRHRCRPCATLLATKKPVQSVSAVAAKVGVAV